jgi:hypothetical protein
MNIFKNLVWLLCLMLVVPPLLGSGSQNQQKPTTQQVETQANTSVTSLQKPNKKNKNADKKPSEGKRFPFFKICGVGFASGVVMGVGWLFVGPVAIAVAGAGALVFSAIEILR